MSVWKGPAEASEPILDEAARADFQRCDDERRAAAYAAFFGPVTGQVVETVVPRLGQPRGPVLDAGCGDGTLAAALAEAGWRPVPVDSSAAMARLTMAATGSAVVADALRLPVRTGSLPAVVSAFLVPHLPDLPAALAELRRVLRAGGRLVLATWESAAASPFTGLVTDVVATLAPERAELLGELARRADGDQLAESCEHAGLRPDAVDAVTMVAALPSVDAWWSGLLSASCGLGGLVQSLPVDVRRAARATFDAEAAAYLMADGSVVVPASAALVSAQAAG